MNNNQSVSAVSFLTAASPSRAFCSSPAILKELVNVAVACKPTNVSHVAHTNTKISRACELFYFQQIVRFRS